MYYKSLRKLIKEMKEFQELREGDIWRVEDKNGKETYVNDPPSRWLMEEARANLESYILKYRKAAETIKLEALV